MTNEMPTTKQCPFCGAEISLDAKKCPQCNKKLEWGFLSKLIIVLVVAILGYVLTNM